MVIHIKIAKPSQSVAYRMKNECTFMKELAKHLELKGGAESGLGAEAVDFVRVRVAKEGVVDLRQMCEDDPNRMARMQSAQLLEEIAPERYNARRWAGAAACAHGRQYLSLDVRRARPADAEIDCWAVRLLGY